MKILSTEPLPGRKQVRVIMLLNLQDSCLPFLLKTKPYENVLNVENEANQIRVCSLVVNCLLGLIPQ